MVGGLRCVFKLFIHIKCHPNRFRGYGAVEVENGTSPLLWPVATTPCTTVGLQAVKMSWWSRNFAHVIRHNNGRIQRLMATARSTSAIYRVLEKNCQNTKNKNINRSNTDRLVYHTNLCLSMIPFRVPKKTDLTAEAFAKWPVMVTRVPPATGPYDGQTLSTDSSTVNTAQTISHKVIVCPVFCF